MLLNFASTLQNTIVKGRSRYIIEFVTFGQ
nr:MAG TPA: hypothetical protein [Caudoviricetes sp.]DAX08611.1 MAG TPA: hypothetical protein [Caudoviricetes sp.]